MIDRMQRRPLGRGVCELCEGRIATRKARFKAQYLESASSGLFDEERLSSVEMEKRVCEECLESMKNAKNISDLTFERL